MDELVFAEEFDEPPKVTSSRETWKILIVDDEKDVHEATLLALGREEICDRPLMFEHAYSSLEAKEVLEKDSDFAVILLDVVMENEFAGIEFVHHVRKNLGILDTRIILRTGQPGYAPELESIAKYEINDYKSKSELTRSRLFTVITSSIRAYTQIRELEQNKNGLESIISASKELLYLRNSKHFAEGVIKQLTNFFNMPSEGFVCIEHTNSDLLEPTNSKVIAATGDYKNFSNLSASEISDATVVARLQGATNTKRHLFDSDYSCLYFSTPDGTEMLVYLAGNIQLNETGLRLIELFSTSISAGIDNVTLLEQRHANAYQDQLLGIPNRLSFLQFVQKQLNEKRKDLRVVMIDIDQFAAINDTIGTENGDVLLKQLSKRLREQHQGQLVARISGDTFGIVGSAENLSKSTISECLVQPFSVENSQHFLTVTQGQVQIDNQRTPMEVLAQANTALKRAKQTLRGSSVQFHQDMLAETENRVHLLQSLKQAFDREGLYMVYQPKVNVINGALVGFEALMRWKTIDGQFIPPDKFIPLAETSGLIVPLGEWALKTSLVELRKLRAESGLELTMAVNVSVVQFAHPNFGSMIESALAFSKCEPAWLDLEITESFAMHDMESVQNIISELSLRGIRISIDDFGTGFSSLSYLEKLKVNTLKIDKSFIDRIQADDVDTRIPETILKLGQSLGLQVVAEGVETSLQHDWLKSNSCDLAQGYLFAKPLEAKDIHDWILNNKQPPTQNEKQDERPK